MDCGKTNLLPLLNLVPSKQPIGGGYYLWVTPSKRQKSTYAWEVKYRELFIQKTLFSILYIQFLKYLKEKKKKTFDVKSDDYHQHKQTSALFYLHKWPSFAIPKSICGAFSLRPYRNIISSPSTNCFLIVYNTFVKCSQFKDEATALLCS